MYSVYLDDAFPFSCCVTVAAEIFFAHQQSRTQQELRRRRRKGAEVTLLSGVNFGGRSCVNHASPGQFTQFLPQAPLVGQKELTIKCHMKCKGGCHNLSSFTGSGLTKQP